MLLTEIVLNTNIIKFVIYPFKIDKYHHKHYNAPPFLYVVKTGRIFKEYLTKAGILNYHKLYSKLKQTYVIYKYSAYRNRNKQFSLNTFIEKISFTYFNLKLVIYFTLI